MTLCGNCTLSLVEKLSVTCNGTCERSLCDLCADLKPSQCEALRSIPGNAWKCKECRTQKLKDNDVSTNDLKDILTSMKHKMEVDREERRSEISDIKETIDEDRHERKSEIGAINRKLECVSNLKSQVEKVEECVATYDDRLNAIETSLENFNTDQMNIRQTNTIIRELREIENRGKNIILNNVPEPESKNPEERKKEDSTKVLMILGELKLEDITPVNVIRVGQKSHYDRKLLVITNSTASVEKILERAETTILSNNVFLSRDRTYNQRAEARLYREEKEKENGDPEAPTQRGIARGRQRGRPRGRGRGDGTRGRGDGSHGGRGGNDRGRGETNHRGRGRGGWQGQGEMRGSVIGRGSTNGKKRKASDEYEYETDKRRRSDSHPNLLLTQHLVPVNNSNRNQEKTSSNGNLQQTPAVVGENSGEDLNEQISAAAHDAPGGPTKRRVSSSLSSSSQNKVLTLPPVPTEPVDAPLQFSQDLVLLKLVRKESGRETRSGNSPSTWAVSEESPGF